LRAAAWWCANLPDREIQSRADARGSLFVTGGAGSSFGGHPPPTEEFQFGLPFRLSAFDVGEQRAPNYAAVTVGYLRGLGPLPDFVGGPTLAGTWLENGAAFDRLSDAQIDTHVGAGVILETLVGPALAGVSVGFDGRRRYYAAIGRVFP
jgi:hypothetical protein